MGEDGKAWSGRRDPNTSLAWTVIAIGAGLLLVVAWQAVYLDADFNPYAVALIVLAMIAYGAISFTSNVEMRVELGDDRLSFTKRESSLGRVIREGTSTVERGQMAKVVERNAGLGVRVVRVEDADGRRLLTFPEFMGPSEHDAMMTAIVEWGGQDPSSDSVSGSEETPLPESR